MVLAFALFSLRITLGVFGSFLVRNVRQRSARLGTKERIALRLKRVTVYKYHDYATAVLSGEAFRYWQYRGMPTRNLALNLYMSSNGTNRNYDVVTSRINLGSKNLRIETAPFPKLPAKRAQERVFKDDFSKG